MTDASGGSSNWSYDCTRQLGGDFYFTATGGWAQLTLLEWSLFTESDWDTLPVDGSAAVYARVSVYDPAGNRITQTDPDSGAVTTSTYDAANRLLTSEDASGITTYTYDANGNQLTIEEPNGDVTTNTWDGENRLVQVEHPDSSVTTYAYNADGLKVEQDDGLEVTRFLYDGNNLLRESDDVGTLQAELTYMPQPYAQLVSQQRDGDSSFYHFDGIKNASELSDSGGVVTDEYAHDAWGVPRSTSGYTANAHTYKGELVAYHGDPDAGPEESIYSLHHRDYVAQQGRFRSEDAAEDDHNPYRYVHNNPVNAVDPSGLQEGPDLDRLLETMREMNPLEYEYLQRLRVTIAVRSGPGKRYEIDKNGKTGGSTLTLSGELSQYQSYVLVLSQIHRAEGFAEFRERWLDELNIPPSLEPGPGDPNYARYQRRKEKEAREQARKFMRQAGATEEEIKSDDRFLFWFEILKQGGYAEQGLHAFTPFAAKGIAASAGTTRAGSSVARPSRHGSGGGETSSTIVGKDIHKTQANLRRSSGDFDMVQTPFRDANGNPILVPQRIDLKTGKPRAGTSTQEAIPDAVSRKHEVVVDDKPLGRSIAKDRQEIIRNITGYEEKYGTLPRWVAIQRYDPKTGRPIHTELYSPKDFLP